MMALLPGIDANDEHKAQSVFRFYVMALSSLPVIEAGFQADPSLESAHEPFLDCKRFRHCYQVPMVPVCRATASVCRTKAHAESRVNQSFYNHLMRFASASHTTMHAQSCHHSTSAGSLGNFVISVTSKEAQHFPVFLW